MKENNQKQIIRDLNKFYVAEIISFSELLEKTFQSKLLGEQTQITYTPDEYIKLRKITFALGEIKNAGAGLLKTLDTQEIYEASLLNVIRELNKHRASIEKDEIHPAMQIPVKQIEKESRLALELVVTLSTLIDRLIIINHIPNDLIDNLSDPSKPIGPN